jgi:radical SAM superfamily enzyme YgiQ (UPF0313 family)
MADHWQNEKVRVGLVQIAGLNRVHQSRQEWQIKNGIPLPKPVYKLPDTATFVYVPYSVGLLQAYAQKHAPNPDRYEFLLPLYKQMDVQEAVEQLRGADVVGFSAYVWNIRLSLAIARALKEAQPETLIVFGGPQVPDNGEDFLRENPFIDIACHGEGEQVFLAILEQASGRNWSGIPSISYLRDGQFIANLRAARTVELPEIPSPYLEGVFDRLMTANPQHQWLAISETNRGCPFSCSFCDWGSAVASKVYRFDLDRVKAEIDWFVSHGIHRIFICDANFGILPRDIEIAEYLVEVYKRHRSYAQVIIQNTKNATERAYKINKIFSQITTAGVTLSLQSVDPLTLRNIKRDNISLDSFHELQRRYTRDNIETYTDMIIGLPGETYDSFTNGIARVMENGQHNRLAFYNCSVLPNAEMGNPEYRRQYGMVTVPVPMINEHDSLDWTAADTVQERLDTVITTAAMPPDEWLRTKVFCWMTELLHYNRLLQIVFILLHKVYGLHYRTLIEAVIAADPERFPISAEIRAMFLARAKANQGGAPEYVPDEKWLRVWWPVHQHALIRIATENKFDRFYEEAQTILTELLEQQGIDYNSTLLKEAFSLNYTLLRMPFRLSDVDLELSYNIWELYQGTLFGELTTLQQRPSRYHINRTSNVWLSWEDWCSDLIARQYKRSLYLYPVKNLNPNPVVAHPVADVVATSIPIALVAA